MTSTHSTRRRLAVSLATGLASAALLVPAAGAARPDDRPGVRGRGAPASPAARAPRPDDRPGIRGPGALQQALHPLAVARDTFDWGDAAAGAGAAAGALALAGGTALATRRGRRVAVTARDQ